MSVKSIQSILQRTQSEILSLQQKLTSETKHESEKSARILVIKKSITRTTSTSMLQSKQRDIGRLEQDIVSIQKKKADLTKRIADKTAVLHKQQQQLYDEQAREQTKVANSLKRKDEDARRRQDLLLQQINHSSIGTQDITMSEASPVSYDAFISHASEDKEDLVRPLAEKLREAGFSIWYDEFQLKVGDGLRRSIDKGLAISRFGIVVLSPSFFAKNWPQYELDGLVAREMASGKVILPLWHKVSKNEVISYSPSLADKIALNTAMYTIDELVKELGDVLRTD